MLLSGLVLHVIESATTPIDDAELDHGPYATTKSNFHPVSIAFVPLCERLNE